MSFQFSAGLSTTPNKFKGKEINPIAYESDHTEHQIIFVTEEINKNWLRYITLSMGKRFPSVGFKVIRVFPFEVTEDQIKQSGGAKKFYFKNCPSLQKLVLPGQRIVPIGRALMSVTLDPDILTEAFYDSQFQNTYFYAPELKCYTFPVDPTYKWYSKYEKRSLDNFYRKFLWDQIERAVNPPKIASRIKTVFFKTVENVREFLYNNWEVPKVSWDLETGSLDFLSKDIICMTMSFEGKTGYYLRFKDIEDLQLLDDFMEGKYQIGANLKFDIKFMRYVYPFKNLKVDFDTMHAGHTLNEMRSNSLKTHAWMYTQHGGYDLELERYKLKYPRLTSYRDIPESILRPYATMDAIVCFQIYEKMLEELRRTPNLFDYFFNIRMPLVRLFPQIELTGVNMDWDMVNKVSHEFSDLIDEIEKEMLPIFGKINYNGDDLPIKIEELGWPCLGRTKKGLYQINKTCMNEWIDLGMNGAELLQKRQKLITARSMFVGIQEEESGFWRFKGPNGHIHPNFLVMLANSHRLRCKSPNLQQFPKHSKEAKLIRKCFVGLSDDYAISESDYDGLQLRIGAILSGDLAMTDVFINQGGDMHSITGHSIFFKFPQKFYLTESGDEVLLDMLSPEDIKDQSKILKRLLTLQEFLKWKKISPSCKEARRKAKGFNFGLLFGATVHGVCYNVIMKDWTPEECITFIQDMNLEMPEYNKKNPKASFEPLAMKVAEFTRTEFFNTYSGLLPWIDDCHLEGKTKGYIECVHGSRRLFPQMLYRGKDTDRKEWSNWENITVNSRVQNFEVVAVARAMIGIDNDLKDKNMKSCLFGQIHDAIQMYVLKEEFKDCHYIIKSNMEKMYPEYNGISLTAEADIADPSNEIEERKTYWGDCPVWNGESYENLYVN